MVKGEYNRNSDLNLVWQVLRRSKTYKQDFEQLEAHARRIGAHAFIESIEGIRSGARDEGDDLLLQWEVREDGVFDVTGHLSKKTEWNSISEIPGALLDFNFDKVFKQEGLKFIKRWEHVIRFPVPPDALYLGDSDLTALICTAPIIFFSPYSENLNFLNQCATPFRTTLVIEINHQFPITQIKKEFGLRVQQLLAERPPKTKVVKKNNGSLFDDNFHERLTYYDQQNSGKSIEAIAKGLKNVDRDAARQKVKDGICAIKTMIEIIENAFQ